MITTQALVRLTELGLTCEQLREVALIIDEAVNGNAGDEQRRQKLAESAERRRLKDRGRKAALKAARYNSAENECNSAEIPQNSDAAPFLDKKVPPYPLKKLNLTPKEKTPKGVKKKGVPLPIDWQPGNDELDDGLKIGFSENEILHIAEKFRDYWIAKPGKDRCKLDWRATFRNWLRNEKERQRGRSPPRVTNHVNQWVEAARNYVGDENENRIGYDERPRNGRQLDLQPIDESRLSSSVFG